MNCAYNIAVRIVYLGKIRRDIAEVAAQLLDHGLVVAEVLVYRFLKRSEIVVIAVYKLLEGLCVLLIFNKGFVHGNKSVLIISVVKIIISELLEIRLCFGKVLFTLFCNKCVGVVRRSDIHGGEVAYHKSVICADCGNAVNIRKGRLVVFVVHNRNGVIARLCKYIVDSSVCACGKYGLFPVLRNYIFLGRFADKKSKTLCVQLFAEVGGMGGFCACLNGNAVADFCVLGYGSDVYKTDAVFNALGLACSRIEPLGGIISGAGFAAGKLGSNTGNYNLISVMELIGTYIGIVSAIFHSSCVNINAVDKQCINGVVNQAHVVLGHSLFYLRHTGVKCIKGSSADIDRIPNGGFAGFKGHCGVVIAVGADCCGFIAEVHIFDVLKAYGDIHRTYKRIEFFRKSPHMLFKVLEHLVLARASAFFVEYEVNIGFKVVPRTDKRLP